MKTSNCFLVLLFLLFTVQICVGQETETLKYSVSNKGKFFINWGWNRAAYTNSDIQFKGNDYDFELHDVKASDRPKGIHIDYINPTRITIPQVNYRIGYFFTDKYNVSLGLDHMKYVMIQDQTVDISGYNNYPGYEDDYAINSTKKLTGDFLTFEHTDGLNYLNAEITRFDDVSKLIKSNTDIFQLNAISGLGLGVLYPRTNTTLMDFNRYDEFHVAGYGASLKLGLNFAFFKHFFIQTELKGGYINMPDIRTTMSSSDSASQDFWFLQRNILIGGIFKL